MFKMRETHQLLNRSRCTKYHYSIFIDQKCEEWSAWLGFGVSLEIYFILLHFTDSGILSNSWDFNEALISRKFSWLCLFFRYFVHVQSTQRAPTFYAKDSLSIPILFKGSIPASQSKTRNYPTLEAGLSEWHVYLIWTHNRHICHDYFLNYCL